MSATTDHYATTAGLHLLDLENNQPWEYSIDPIKLAYLDFRLFKTLCELGASRERICSVLTINYEDFDYLRKLSST